VVGKKGIKAVRYLGYCKVIKPVICFGNFMEMTIFFGNFVRVF
jgi:hypothetical protein